MSIVGVHPGDASRVSASGGAFWGAPGGTSRGEVRPGEGCIQGCIRGCIQGVHLGWVHLGSAPRGCIWGLHPGGRGAFMGCIWGASRMHPLLQHGCTSSPRCSMDAHTPPPCCSMDEPPLLQHGCTPPPNAFLYLNARDGNM